MKTPLPSKSIIAITFSLLLIFSCQTVEKNDLSPSQNKTDLIIKGPGKFAQAHSLIRTLDGKSSPSYKSGDRFKEYVKAKSLVTTKNRQNLEWIERGPGNVGGRVRGLVVDPADSTSRTWFVGSVSGGLWYTENAGETWEQLTREFSSLATSTIAMAPSNQNVLYVGTGEGFNNIDGIVGTGIWKSTDRGRSWNILEATTNGEFDQVSRLIVNPDNENEVLATTRYTNDNDTQLAQIMKSTDGGETWTSKFLQSNTVFGQIIAAPNNFNTMYINASSRGIFKSEDAGETWANVFNPNNGEGRIEMAISPNDDGVIYLSCQLGNGSRLYFTRDTFNTVTEPLFDGIQPNWLASQGWYDNTIAVHPYNDSIIWVGGAGPILELKMGKEIGTITKYGGFNSLAPFIKPIEGSQFNEEPTGLAFSLFTGLPISTETSDEDLINVEIRLGDNLTSKAHLISVNLGNFDFNFESMVDVPFQAWDSKNNRQIAMTVFDVNGDGTWTFDDFSGQSNPIHDVVTTNNIDYSDTANVTISTINPVYKSQYYIFMGRAPSYTGPKDTLPFGILFFNTKQEDGLISSFTPIADGYTQYTEVAQVGTKGVHVDHHNIIMLPKDSATGLFYVLNANDGGVAYSEDSGETFKQTGDSYNDGSFISLNGFNTSQFYGIDKMNGEYRYIGGTQDNGTWLSPFDADSTSIWAEAPSGDGFEAAWHYENTNLLLETSQFNRLYKSYDQGLNWDFITLPESRGPFISRLASSQINPDLVFMVSDTGVLRSTDFAETWEIIEMPERWDFQGSWGGPITISLADPDYVWSGSRITADSRLCYSADGGLTFNETRNFPESTLGLITGLATHPNDSQTAYVLFSQKFAPKILMTNDLGRSWTDLSGYAPSSTSEGFPNVATYCLLVMPWDEDVIWAGTEIGIFQSINGGATWEFADLGLPAVSVWQMKLVNDEIVVATHGRGVWTLNTSQLQVSSIVEPSISLAGELNVFPNPMAARSLVSYRLDEAQNIRITLLSIDGKIIKTIYKGQAASGINRIDFIDEGLSQGMYFIHLQGEKGLLTQRVIVQ